MYKHNMLYHIVIMTMLYDIIVYHIRPPARRAGRGAAAWPLAGSVCIYICVRVCVCVCICMYVYICICIYIYICTSCILYRDVLSLSLYIYI